MGLQSLYYLVTRVEQLSQSQAVHNVLYTVVNLQCFLKARDRCNRAEHTTAFAALLW